MEYLYLLPIVFMGQSENPVDMLSVVALMVWSWHTTTTPSLVT